MYKSYSSTVKVDKDSRVVISEFKAASVKLDVQLSGFPTSYSYYVANEEGSGITSKDVAKANATANDWIGDGKATYTITREGIPSTLLKFESFKLTVDGKEFTGNESDKTITYGGDDCNGHTTWGQKDIVATVTYTNLATGKPETESKILTRHITGLPYNANPPKNNGNNPWSGSNKYSFESSYVQFGEWGSANGGSCSLQFSNPTGLNATIKGKIDAHSATVSTTSYIEISGQRIFECKANSYKTETLESSKEVVLPSNCTIKAGTTYGAGKTYGRLYYIEVVYR